MNYGYIEYEDLAQAQSAFEHFNQMDVTLDFDFKPHNIHLLYTQKQLSELTLGAEATCVLEPSIPGLQLYRDFITPEQEIDLIHHLDQGKWITLTNRRVQHYGFDFIYGRNSVNPDDPSDNQIPDWFNFLLDALEVQYGFRFDQITVNDYQPGDSIPPHIDSAEPFEEPILSLSLLSGIGMNFRREREVTLYLPARSLLAMTGESRYEWRHSISQRRYDVLDGFTLYRQRRVSLTFRKIRNLQQYLEEQKVQMNERAKPTETELEYVYATYDKIAPHFSHTRYKPWPLVEKFLTQLPLGSIVLDIGCGNGKYLAGDPIFRLGTDRSEKLLEICVERGFNVFTADCLELPVRSNSVDAVICIAVIHHLSQIQQRLQAVQECIRIMKPGGQGLVYVWAKEQTERQFEENDCFVPWHLQQVFEKGDITGEVNAEKNSVVYKRFYHVFNAGELEALFTQSQGIILESYFDRSNWCVKFTKQ